MLIARVIGEVVATEKHASHVGRKALLVQPLNLDGTDRGDAVVALDKPPGLPAVPVKGSDTPSALSLLSAALKRNRQRALVVHRIDRFTSGILLFAKSDPANITQQALAAFKDLAKAYEALSEERSNMLLDRKDVLEMCHGEKIQKRGP